MKNHTLPLTRIPSLAAAGVLVALTMVGIPACTDESVDQLSRVGPSETALEECQQYKRAKSRRACRARLAREAQTDIAGK